MCGALLTLRHCLMADMRILAAIRRFMTPAQIEALYLQIFTAYTSRIAEVTVIVGKSTEGESAQAQVVVDREDYKDWIEALEELMQENEGTNANGPVHTSFLNRYTET